MQGREDSITGTEEVLGTPLYMAPECFTQSQHSSAVNIYAVGCMLYECLTGVPAFSAENFVRFAHKHQVEMIPQLPAGAKEKRALTSALQAIIEKACAKDAQARFKSTEEFAASLEDALEGRALPTPGAKRATGRLRVGASVAVIMLGILFSLPKTPIGQPDAAKLHLLQRAVQRKEKTFGPHSPDVAASLLRLGNSYKHEGKLAEAEPPQTYWKVC